MPKPAAPDILARWLAPFEALFTRPTWRHVVVLIAGAVLAPGPRTVASALSVMGLRGGRPVSRTSTACSTGTAGRAMPSPGASWTSCSAPSPRMARS